eukprot:11679245-Ditylum_brightwellii.AAC.1
MSLIASYRSSKGELFIIYQSLLLIGLVEGLHAKLNVVSAERDEVVLDCRVEQLSFAQDVVKSKGFRQLHLDADGGCLGVSHKFGLVKLGAFVDLGHGAGCGAYCFLQFLSTSTSVSSYSLTHLRQDLKREGTI